MLFQSKCIQIKYALSVLRDIRRCRKTLNSFYVIGEGDDKMKKRSEKGHDILQKTDFTFSEEGDREKIEQFL